MHQFSIGLVFMGLVLIAINARSPPLSKSVTIQRHSCPEEYRELRRREDDSQSESNDDEDDDIEATRWRERVCEHAMTLIVRHRYRTKIDPTLLRTYCPHYDESLILARENNDTLCENQKQQLNSKRKRQEITKKKRDGDLTDSDDDDEDDKRRALRRREIKKRLAFSFIRKRM